MSAPAQLVTVPASVRFSESYRRTHIGASQWPAAVGADPYCEPIELFEKYMGIIPWDDGEPNDAAELGHVLEDFIAKIAARRLGLGIVASETIEHPDFPWLICTPDRLVEDGSNMQVKSTGLITRGAYLEEWGTEGTDEIPHRVIVQVTAEMMILRARGFGCSHTHVAAFVGQRGVLLYRVDYDEELARMLFGQVQAFWRCVTEKRAPKPDATEAFSVFLARRYPTHDKGNWLEANEAITAAALVLKDARAKIEAEEERERSARNYLCGLIGDAEGIKGEWGQIAWRAVKGRESLKVAGLVADLKAKFGDVIDEYVAKHTERGNGYRAFKPTFKEIK